MPTWVPLMTLHSPSRTSSASRSDFLASLRFAQPSFRTSTPFELVRPSGALSMENPLPGVALPSTLVSVPASPRRGLPHPLRSAFAVSHDPDGLSLSMPCGVFQPLTPMGFVSPAPSSGASTSALRPTLPYRGDGFHPGGSWSFRARVAAEAASLVQTAAPFARRLPVRLQLSCSSVAACIRRPPASHPKVVR